MRAIAVDWLSHWTLILPAGAVGIYFGWWGILGCLIGWTMMNLVYRLGASDTEREPNA